MRIRIRIRNPDFFCEECGARDWLNKVDGFYLVNNSWQISRDFVTDRTSSPIGWYTCKPYANPRENKQYNAIFRKTLVESNFIVSQLTGLMISKKPLTLCIHQGGPLLLLHVFSSISLTCLKLTMSSWISLQPSFFPVSCGDIVLKTNIQV
jgi:hypothetical protein